MRFELQTKHYYWTRHVHEKMKFYGLSEQRVKRVIRNPERAEQGVAPKTIAVMQPVIKRGKTTQEFWAMYRDRGHERIVITAWRYPGKSPIRDGVPIPDDIQQDLDSIISSIDSQRAQ